ncbi:hypothetical protein GCM10025331_51680 [Actinoplanes utahensis]|nr:hypothetical protein Aut01nite_65970 [Actinoplanes utahensis]
MQLGGWDGNLIATEPSAYIPRGLSVWELSVEKSPGTKADKDYDKRNATPDGSPRSDCTYVALIVRPWKDRQTWANRRTAEGVWKKVIALGVDDLETWLEVAPVTQAWLAQHLGSNPYGLRPVDLWWETWAQATTPPISPHLIIGGPNSNQPSRALLTTSLIERLAGMPQVTTIKADSLDEAQAFIAAALLNAAKEGDDQLLARAAFVDDLNTLRALMSRPNSLIIIPVTAETRREAETAKRHHILTPLIDTVNADIALPPIDPDAALEVLKDAGLEQHRAARLGRVARRSLLAMRREIANKPELHQPPWARPPVDRSRRGFLLAGRWHDGNDHDQSVVAALAGMSHDEARERADELSTVADPMMGRIDRIRALISPYDAWSQMGPRIQPDDFDRLEFHMLSVLGEVDRRLEYPAGRERFRAGLEGVGPKYSAHLRNGLASSLALLGASGETIDAGSGRTGASWASAVISKLLRTANDDLTGNTWRSAAPILPLLAEAAPDAFLAGTAKGLEGEPPLLASLFESPEEDGLLGAGSHHTHLLWSLENIVWSAPHFGQAVEIIARLAEIDPGGRLSNRPAATLAAIFSPWHPDNSVDAVRRLAVLDAMRRRHPSVAWRLMINMLPRTHSIHFPIHEPAYRSWKPSSATVTYGELATVIENVVERLTQDAGGDAARWGELIVRISDIAPAERARQLDQLTHLAAEGAFSETDRAKLWDSLREVVAKHREYADSSWALPADEVAKIEEVMAPLEPPPSELHFLWLFQDYTPELTEYSIRNDHNAYFITLAERRRNAVQQIYESEGFVAVRELAVQAEQVAWVGTALADAAEDYCVDILLPLVGSTDRVDRELAASFVWRRFHASGWPWLEDVLSRSTLTDSQRGIALLESRDFPLAWERADELGAEASHAFWQNFQPYGLGGDFASVDIAAERLIGVGRANAGIALINLYVKRGGQQTIRLLGLAADALEALLVQEDIDFRTLRQHDFQQLFDLFYEHEDALGWERIGRLEWHYLPALGFDAEPRMLGAVLARDPNFFVQIVKLAFRPESQEIVEDPSPFSELEQYQATNAYRLLREWSVPPGYQASGQLDAQQLRNWIEQAKRGLKTSDRSTVGLQFIGSVLAKAPADPDDSWPRLVVRDLIEEERSEALEAGFFMSVVNSRGVTSRGLGDGGQQERDLVEKYRRYADMLADEWPRTGAVLRALADQYSEDARRQDASAEYFRRGEERP